MAKPKTLMARVGLDTAEFESGIRRVDRELRKLGDLGKIASDATKLFAGAIGAATAATAALAARGAMLADNFEDMAQRLGLSTGAVAELSHVARMSGIDLGKLEQGLAKLAKQGPVEEELAKLADQMAAMGSHTDRTRLAIKVFGEDAGPKLVPLLKDGAAGLTAMREEARKLGLTLNDFQAQQLAKVNDAFDKFKSASEGVQLQLAGALAPALTAIAETLSEELGGALGDSKEDVLGWGETVGDVIALAADASLGAIKTISTGFRSVGQTLGAAGAAAVALVTDGTEAAASVFDEWQNDQAEMWDRLANDTNLRAFRDRLAEIRADGEAAGREAKNALRSIGEGLSGGGTLEPFKVEPFERKAVLAEFEGVDALLTKLRNARLEQERAAIAQRFAELQQSFLSESELEIARYESQLELLAETEATRAATIEEIYAAREAAQQEHESRMQQIREKAAKGELNLADQLADGKLATALRSTKAIFSAAADDSKRAFELTKKLAKAEIAITAPSAIAKAVERAGGLPWGAWAGAATALEFASRLSQINAAQFNGGGTVATMGAASAASAPAPAAAAPARENRALFIQGIAPDALFTGSQLRQLGERLSEFLKDGGQITFAET